MTLALIAYVLTACGLVAALVAWEDRRRRPFHYAMKRMTKGVYRVQRTIGRKLLPAMRDCSAAVLDFNRAISSDPVED